MAAPDDEQIRTLGNLIMEPNPVRTALSGMVFVSSDPEDAAGRVETTFQMLLQVDSAWQAFSRARSRGELKAWNVAGALQEAAANGVISPEEAAALAAYNARRFDCLLTDEFDP